MTTELFDSGHVRKKKVFVHGSHNLNGQIEWYTPPQYIASAKRVMRTIDLDPCTSRLAQETVQAKRFFTIDDDGLSQNWTGTVWLNPPYAAAIIRRFVDKLLGHLGSEVSQAIMLTHNNADTLWFHKAAARAAAVCFTRGRVRFYDEKGTANSPTHGHCFMYFGKSPKKFAKEFRQYGWIGKEF